MCQCLIPFPRSSLTLYPAPTLKPPPNQPLSADSAYDHWLIVFTYSVLFTIARWGAALLFGAVAKRTAESAPPRMRSQVVSLVGLVRLAGSLLGPILVSVVNSLCLVHSRDSFAYGWAFVLCALGLIGVIVVNGIVLVREEVEQARKEEGMD